MLGDFSGGALQQGKKSLYFYGVFYGYRIIFQRIIRSISTEDFYGIPYISTMLNCLLSVWYGMGLRLLGMESLSLPVMIVLSLFADLVMNMRGEKVIRLALIARPDTSATKVIGEVGVEPCSCHLLWRMPL